MTDETAIKRRGPLKVIVFTGVITALLVACTQSSNTCDGQEGLITHSTIEITGIKSTSIQRQVPNSTVVEAVDQVSGTEFSNMEIVLELSWIAEQHRFRTQNTFIQSFLDWFIPPAYACSLPDYYEEFEPAVNSVEIYSDSDFNPELVAGSDLSEVFQITGLISEAVEFPAAQADGRLLSAKQYSLQAAWINGELSSVPVTPKVHAFTLLVTLDDGRAFEVRTAEVLLDGA